MRKFWSEHRTYCADESSVLVPSGIQLILVSRLPLDSWLRVSARKLFSNTSCYRAIHQTWFIKGGIYVRRDFICIIRDNLANLSTFTTLFWEKLDISYDTTPPVSSGLNSIVIYQVTCIGSSKSMVSNSREKGIRTSISTHWFFVIFISNWDAFLYIRPN